MIDYTSIKASDFDKSRAFYEAALAPLGYVVVMEFEGAVGMGSGGFPDFWLGAGGPSEKVHIAFRGDRAAVDAFHVAAMKAGGADNGAPGLRLNYHPTYYAAFALDPDGNNIEAVCHKPE